MTATLPAKLPPLNCPAEISFGLDVKRPGRLETRSTGEVLLDIQSGAWQDTVARVRSLPHDSPEQKAAKQALPFATWAGVFSYKANDRLVQHSGQIGVDVDDLGEAGAVTVLQTAVADRFCLAAFRSARGEGVRLLFRVPPCNAREHPNVFEQVAEHVRKTYDHEPDPSGKDVSRASFMSFDAGLWVFPLAEVLPIRIERLIHSGIKAGARCVSPSLYGGQLALTCWSWYGRHYANTSPRQDGTARTHHSLLELGKAVALHAERIREPLTKRHIEEAFNGWRTELARQGVSLRVAEDEYRAELNASVKGAQRKPWFKAAAEKWIRWTQHVEFPCAGLPHEKLLFAIRQHCADAGTNEFFLGVRDAALITGGHFTTGARLLRKLVADGYLVKIPDVKRPRHHAYDYRLKE